MGMHIFDLHDGNSYYDAITIFTGVCDDVWLRVAATVLFIGSLHISRIDSIYCVELFLFALSGYADFIRRHLEYQECGCDVYQFVRGLFSQQKAL